MEPVQTHKFWYEVQELRATFISKDALQAMGAISEEFPLVSEREESRLVAELADQQQAVLETIQRLEVQSELAPFGCPSRVSAPSPPALPFPATESNRQRLKEFLLSYYKYSTFNVCPHQPNTPHAWATIGVQIGPDAKQFAVYSPATVPAHWAKQVKADIQRGMQLEKVEHEMDSRVDDWCSRMVIILCCKASPAALSRSSKDKLKFYWDEVLHWLCLGTEVL